MKPIRSEHEVSTCNPAIKEYIACFCFFVLVMVFLFRVQISSDFGMLLAGRGDGIIEVSILEHWYNTFLGNSNWRTVNYFYPYTNTIGYNDTYLLYGSIYSIFRALGLDIFLSGEMVTFTVKAVGYFSFYYLSRLCFKNTATSSIVGAILFTISNTIYLQSVHQQLLTVAFAPLLTIFLYKYIFGIISNQPRIKNIKNGVISALIISLWIMTTFYMSWFYILFSLIFIPTLLIYLKLKDRVHFNLKKNTISIIIPLITATLALIPFLSIYLNKLKETGGQSLYEAMYYTPKLFNLFNMGVDNLVYGKLTEIITPKGYNNKYYSGEFIIGFSPLMILALVLVSFYLWRNKNKDIGLTAYKSLIISIVISCVIMVNIDGKSLWEIVWNYIPGAKGIRVASRFAIFLVFPVCIIITYLLSKISATKYKHLGLLFSALFILEQVNNAEIHNLDRKEHLSFLNAVGSPPLECRAFFVTKQRPNEFSQQKKADIYPHNVDAMLVSEVYNIRTVNGFTTFNPPGWDFKLYPLDTYASRVNNYIKNNNIENGMCELDLFNHKWIVHKFATPPMLIPVDISNIKLSVNYDGKYKLTIDNDTNIKIGKGTNYPLNIGVRATDGSGKVINYDVKRITLPVIAPNSSIILDIDLENQMAEYKALDITLVQEGVAWLDDFGLIPVKP